MDRSAPLPPPRSLGNLIAKYCFIALAYALCNAVSVTLLSFDGRLAALWFANAGIIGIVCRRAELRLSLAVAACFAGNIVSNGLLGDKVFTALLLASANAVEIAAVVAVMFRFCGRRPDMSNLRHLGVLVACAAIVPIGSGMIAGFALHRSNDLLNEIAWGQWYAAHALLIPIIAPLTIIISEWRQNPHPVKSAVVIEQLLVGSVVLLCAAVIFSQNSYPLLFLACPVVILATFRTGFIGTAMTVAMFTMFATIATYTGVGPISLVHGDMRTRLFVLQLFLAALFAVGLPVVAVLSNRARVREELRESRDFVAAIVDGVGHVVFKTDQFARWSYLNPSWESLTGIPVDNAMGRYCAELVEPAEVSALKTMFTAIASGVIANVQRQQRVRTAGGKLIDVEVSITRLTDGDGRFNGTVGTIADISDKIAREHALRESEVRFRTLAETAPVGIFQADADGQITYVNDRWSKLLGVPSAQMLGDGWRDALMTGEEFAEDPAFQGFNKPGDVRRRIACFRDSQGEKLWGETVNSAEFGPDGKITGFVGTFADITARKNAEEALRQREEQLALLADNATDAVVRLTLAGKCLYASPSTRELLKIAPEFLIGQQLIAGFHPDDDAAVREQFGTLGAGAIDRTLVSFRSENPHAPGVYTWIEANCGLVRDDATGAPVEIIAALRDATKTKALEADLRDAKVAAEAAASAKSAFLANMSHEIRTPMNGVIGFTELLLSEDLTAQQRQRVDLIAESGRSMMRLLNDILDMAKIEAGQTAIACEPIDLKHKLGGSIRLMEAVAIAKGLDLRLEIDEALPGWIMADPLRLRQIVLNLIGNAVKFTSAGSVILRASLAGKDLVRLLQIDVVDTGIGIPADQIAQVFEQFSQADASIARRYGGTGLGLSISAQLAALMDGTLGCTSLPGAGSTFTLTLPLIEAQPVIAASAVDPAVPDRPAAERKGAVRILVAEDHDINQVLIQQMAGQAGHDVELAANGEIALQMIEQAREDAAPYGLVLMDLQMPIMDGLQATRALRARGFAPAILPIVALTANVHADDVALCLAAGMQAHIPKPVRARDLVDIIDRWAQAAPNAAIINESRPADDLYRRFAARKTETAEVISQTLREGRFDAASLAEIAAMFHKLAGSAAYFDQAELGEKSASWDLELRLADPVQGRAILTAALLALVSG